mgnify:CR=1 FL=1
MAVKSYDLVTVEQEEVTADLLVWRYYRTRAPGILEHMLDVNPHLAKVHRFSPFIPVGVMVRMPVDPSILAGAPQKANKVVLWETKKPPAQVV